MTATSHELFQLIERIRHESRNSANPWNGQENSARELRAAVEVAQKAVAMALVHRAAVAHDESAPRPDQVHQDFADLRSELDSVRQPLRNALRIVEQYLQRFPQQTADQ